MPVTNQKYAFVTAQGWDKSLNERWPDAPLIGEYRLLVFAGADLKPLEAEYSNAEFKYLNVHKTIEQLERGNIGPFICDINQVKQVIDHFTPTEEFE